MKRLNFVKCPHCPHKIKIKENMPNANFFNVMLHMEEKHFDVFAEAILSK